MYMRHTLPLRTLALALSTSLMAACHPAGSAPLAPPGQIVVDASARIGAIRPDQLGTNLGVWYDVTTSSLPDQLAQVAPHVLRWPGGSIADTSHWQQHTQCNGKSSEPAYHPRSTFQNFMSDVLVPGNYSTALTVAYGTNAACSGGGDPREAAAWVAYVKAHGYGPRVRFWTVGNESFGNWETDMHDQAHDPGTYAAAMSGAEGYYALMKRADPTARVGVVVSGTGTSDPWDSIVLSKAPYDFVEVHWYAQAPGKETDDYLLHDAPADFATKIANIKEELAAWGKPGTPIMVGEMNSVGFDPGKQTVSIVNALFTGEVLAEGLQGGLATEFWWFGDGGTQSCGKNDSSSLYGFQKWGSYDLVFGSTDYGYNDCTNNNGGPIVPEGTVSPSGQAFKMVSEFIGKGGSLLSAASGSSDVRAYAAADDTGYALLLLNLSATASENMKVTINGAASSTYTETDVEYGKTQYDQSRDNRWPGPTSRSLRGVGNVFPVTLPPWSITLVRLRH
jgi:hypothetical protein